MTDYRNMPDYDALIQERANDCKLSRDGKANSGAETVVRGYYIWWCNTHNQPWARCVNDIAVKMLQEEWIEAQKSKARVMYVAQRVEVNLPVIEEAVKGIRQRLEGLER